MTICGQVFEGMRQKGRELSLAHFTRGHFEFTVVLSRYMTLNLHIVWRLRKLHFPERDLQYADRFRPS